MKLETIAEVAGNYKTTALAGSTIMLSFATLMQHIQPILACIGLLAGIVLSIVSTRKQLAEIRESNMRTAKMAKELEGNNNNGKNQEG